MRSTLHSRAVQRAADIAGGEAALAAYLNVSPVAVRAWISGVAEVPPEHFLKVVDIITDEEVTKATSPITDTPPASPSRSKNATQ
jgi:DNA-binding transcriptional regulator YdaS (Cro superfamily)